MYISLYITIKYVYLHSEIARGVYFVTMEYFSEYLPLALEVYKIDCSLIG